MSHSFVAAHSTLQNTNVVLCSPRDPNSPLLMSGLEDHGAAVDFRPIGASKNAVDVYPRFVCTLG